MFTITQKGVLSVVGILLLFTLLVFEQKVSTTFLFFLLYSYMLIQADKNISLKFESSPSNRLRDIFVGVGAYFGFLLISSFLIPLLSGIFKFSVESGTTTQSLFASNVLFAQFILSGATLLTFVVWAILIPIVENIFVYRIYEGLLDFFKVPVLKISALGILAAIIIGAVMAAFHLQAKGTIPGASAALFVTLIFFFFTILMSVIMKSGLVGVVMHITANTLALSAILTSITIPPVFLVLIAVGAVLILLRSKMSQKFIGVIGG